MDFDNMTPRDIAMAVTAANRIMVEILSGQNTPASAKLRVAAKTRATSFEQQQERGAAALLRLMFDPIPS